MGGFWRIIKRGMGAVVTVQQASGDVDGPQTRVTGQTTDADSRLLYRLEHRVDGLPRSGSRN